MPDATGKKLTHLDDQGRAKMVDVGHKPLTPRQAVAEGFISLQRATIEAIAAGNVPKGDVFAVARVAGIMAAKKCGELIPLCHPLGVESVEVAFDVQDVRVRIEAIARITGHVTVGAVKTLDVSESDKRDPSHALLECLRNSLDAEGEC